MHLALFKLETLGQRVTSEARIPICFNLTKPYIYNLININYLSYIYDNFSKKCRVIDDALRGRNEKIGLCIAQYCTNFKVLNTANYYCLIYLTVLTSLN